MFDSEDFDLDEEFLNDIGQKEEEYYSQRTESERNSPKRTKIEEIDFLSDASFDDEPDFARLSSKSVEPVVRRIENSEILRGKIIGEENLKKGESVGIENNSKITDSGQNPVKNSQVPANSESNENVEISRRKLALEILRKGSAASEDVSTEKSPSTRSSPLRPISSFNERNSRVDDEQSRRKTLLESFKKPYPKVSKSGSELGEKTSNNLSTRSNAQASRSSHSEKNVEVEDSAERSRRKTLLESFKKPYGKVSKNRSLAIPRVTRVRKFPGPAGLLPDCPDLNFESVNFLNRSDDCDVEKSEEPDDSGMSEWFSQNTEKLFSAGAWRLMLDDLPAGFLRGYEIATMKKTAKSNSRVSLLAGVIARIDHTRQNPRLILKDSSDSIEATMHPDILLAHPNIFEPGVVVLLRHVGVLGFQTSPIFPTLQFHVMIAAKNIVAVYSEKSRIVTSPWMESILGNDENFSNPRKSPTRQIEHVTIHGNAENVRNFSIIDDDIDMSGFETEDDDVFASFNIDDLTASQIATNSPKSSSQSPAHPPTAAKDVKNYEIEENIKQPEPNPSSTKLPHEFVTERCSSAISAEKNSREPSLTPEPKKTATCRSKLMQFRSKHDSSLETRDKVNEIRSSDGQINASDKEERPGDFNMGSTGFGDNLMDSDNDTEDEILSQLDVDSIVTSYNSQT